MAIGRGTIRLRDRAGVSFLFEPGAPCLELMYTGGEGARSVFETLHVPADLDAWLPGFAGAPVNPVTGAGLAAAKRLREALWSCTDALAAGAPLPAAAVAQINRHAARPDLVPVLAAAGDRGWAPPVTLD